MKPCLPIPRCHSSRAGISGQSRQRPRFNNAWTGLLLAMALAQAGCTSLYHRTRAEMPPDPAGELNLRIAEAGRAEERVTRAGTRLLNDLQREPSQPVTRADFDRLEAAAFDLDRQALTAREAAERCGPAASANHELARLATRSESWLSFVRTGRQADRSAQVQDLKDLLGPPK